MDKQHAQEVHSGMQSSMASESPLERKVRDAKIKKEYIEKLTENRLDDITTELIRNLLTPDFILSKVSTAEAEEYKWLARYHAKKIIDMHPHAQSPIKGEYRKVCYDDHRDGLQPLSELQQDKLEQAIMALYWRAKRSHEGWQQEEMSRQYNVSEMHDDKQESGGGRLGGLFS